MKNLLLGVVLMLVSSIAASATITIGNPMTSSNGSPSFSNITNQGNVRSDLVNAGVNLFSTSRDFQTSWKIESFENVSLDLTLAIDLSRDWSVTILSENNTILDQGNLGTIFSGLALSSDSPIFVVLAGSIGWFQTREFNTTLTLSNLAVSEVPLPAAAWLFGSALIGGLAFRRKAAQKRQLALAV